MSKLPYAQATQLQRQIADAAESMLRRHVGSSVSLDPTTDEWVVNLRITSVLRPAEEAAIGALQREYGIRISWTERMEPARFAM